MAHWKYNYNRDYLKKQKADELDIKLIYIVENSRDYEIDIKNQIIEKLIIINKITNLNITKDDIINYKIGDIYSKLYNKDELLNKTKTYLSFKIFREQEPKLYNQLRRLNLLDIATEHMNDRKIKRNITEIREKIKNYKTLGDLIKLDSGTYQYIKTNKLEYLISHLKSRFNK